MIDKLGNQIFRVFSWKLKLHTLLEINPCDFGDLKESIKLPYLFPWGKTVFETGKSGREFEV